MRIKTNDIVSNLINVEPVQINSVMDLGNSVIIEYTGINSRQSGDIIKSKQEVEQLLVLTQKGEFDFSGDPVKFTLYTEAERIRSAYQYDPLFAVNCSIVDPLPHQVEAVYQYLLPLPRMRFLLADDTGAGKTIMTGLLIKELSLRGLLNRILIITPGGLTKQWQEDEMGLKFNINFKLVDRAVFNGDPNVFNTDNRIVTSIDFMRADDVINVLQDTTWDLIVVDEAHKLSAYDYGRKRYRSKRYAALETLAPLTEHLLLLTATPHRGRQDTFRNLLQLLDPDIFSTNELVTQRINREDSNVTNRFFIRRLKEDMKDWNGNPLFKPRHTHTVEYDLTPDEKQLYDKVTKYLSARKQEATEQKNIHVQLALMVMQRRLTSSIYAIYRTLTNRYKALDGVIEVIRRTPSIWQQRMKLEEFELEDFDSYDELTDEGRESLEALFNDPRKFKLFTTAKNVDMLKAEREQVLQLKEMAEELYHNNIEEQKLKQLRQFLLEQEVAEGRKLVIFTEHKDTLEYLEKKLSNEGYNVQTIFGQKSVDERRKAQDNFANDSQILIATDAAGEGINLQFCDLLINWDIPWNPNRLEQRMGRIHRYGQQNEVHVFNLVARNTREGKVMHRLLQKLDVIREQIGSDRVYDVISDVLESVDLDTILKASFDGDTIEFEQAIESNFTKEQVEEKIQAQREQLKTSTINFAYAKKLMNESLEKRLIPLYLQRFFTEAYQQLGGTITTDEHGFIKLSRIPTPLRAKLRERYSTHYDISDLIFTFDKATFLQHRHTGRYEKLYYLNPGNVIYEAMLDIVLDTFKGDVLRGTILIDPTARKDYFAYLVRSQITNSTSAQQVAHEKILLVCNVDGQNTLTSPAKFIDLKPPSTFAKAITPPQPVSEKEVVQWSFLNITEPQYREAQTTIAEDIKLRKQYLQEGMQSLILDYTAELSELQGKLLLGNSKVQDKVLSLEDKIHQLEERTQQRMEELDLRMKLNQRPPKVLASAYVVPLSKVEFKHHYGMSRDDEVEEIAMNTAIQYEVSKGLTCKDVSRENLGYDLYSEDGQLTRRYIEVKGRAMDGAIMISENEKCRLEQLGDDAWLYIVTHCKTPNPQLYRIRDPFKYLRYTQKSKGIQFLVDMKEWKSKAQNS